MSRYGIEIKTQHLSVQEIYKYLSDHCKFEGYGFAKVVKPLKVWKKTTSTSGMVIVALEIPVGAKIYSSLIREHDLGDGWALEDCNDYKFRASLALVVKQFSVEDYIYRDVTGVFRSYKVVSMREIDKSRSKHCHSFEYRTGNKVKPEHRFYNAPYTYESGIHFFINLSSAIEY